MTPRALHERHGEPGPAAEGSLDERDLLQTFLDNTPDHVYFKDVEGRFTRLSRSLASVFQVKLLLRGIVCWPLFCSRR